MHIFLRWDNINNWKYALAKTDFYTSSARNQGTLLNKMHPLSRPLTCMALLERTQVGAWAKMGPVGGMEENADQKHVYFHSGFPLVSEMMLKILILAR